MDSDFAGYWAQQSTVDFPIGGHVNVLSDYKETGPENVLKLTQSMQSCH